MWLTPWPWQDEGADTFMCAEHADSPPLGERLVWIALARGPTFGLDKTAVVARCAHEDGFASFVLSPNRRMVAYIADGRLCVRRMQQQQHPQPHEEEEEEEDTERDAASQRSVVWNMHESDDGNVPGYFWSPDSRYLLFLELCASGAASRLCMRYRTRESGASFASGQARRSACAWAQVDGVDGRDGQRHALPQGRVHSVGHNARELPALCRPIRAGVDVLQPRQHRVRARVAPRFRSC